MSLSGKAVLVTGASAGIGRAIAVALLKKGARVVATGRRLAELETLRQISPNHSIKLLAGDLNEPKFAHRLAEIANGVDIFVNNAGILKYAPVLELSDDDAEAMFRTNVLASLRITQLIARQMVSRKSGHIIFVTSLAAREVYPLGAVYAATKHALSAIARGLRLEVQQHAIRVTEIAPGTVATGIRNANTHPAALAAEKARKFIPLMPDDIAAAVIFVAEMPANCCPELIELRPQGAARA